MGLGGDRMGLGGRGFQWSTGEEVFRARSLLGFTSLPAPRLPSIPTHTPPTPPHIVLTAGALRYWEGGKTGQEGEGSQETHGLEAR